MPNVSNILVQAHSTEQEWQPSIHPVNLNQNRHPAGTSDLSDISEAFTSFWLRFYNGGLWENISCRLIEFTMWEILTG